MNKTLRTIRKLVKLWDIDDLHLDEDLEEKVWTRESLVHMLGFLMTF
jgi:hypothetical protein